MTKNLIVESRRYVENAKVVLQKNGRLNVESRYYEDSKYVRCAGRYLWLATILALDATVAKG